VQPAESGGRPLVPYLVERLAQHRHGLVGTAAQQLGQLAAAGVDVRQLVAAVVAGLRAAGGTVSVRGADEHGRVHHRLPVGRCVAAADRPVGGNCSSTANACPAVTVSTDAPFGVALCGT